jgi:hypothetical protein
MSEDMTNKYEVRGQRSEVRGGVMKKIGLFVGREWSMPPEFIKEVNNRDQGVVAELASIGAKCRTTC